MTKSRTSLLEIENVSLIQLNCNILFLSHLDVRLFASLKHSLEKENIIFSNDMISLLIREDKGLYIRNYASKHCLKSPSCGNKFSNYKLRRMCFVLKKRVHKRGLFTKQTSGFYSDHNVKIGRLLVSLQHGYGRNDRSKIEL